MQDCVFAKGQLEKAVAAAELGVIGAKCALDKEVALAKDVYTAQLLKGHTSPCYY